MRNIVFSLLLVAFAVAEPDICGNIEQCSSLSAAKKCGAVQQCMEGVWKNYDLSTMKETDECMYCEEVVGDVRSQFSDANEKMVQNMLDNLCQAIPIQQMAAECKQGVDENVPEIFQLVRSELDPKAVCSAIGLCGGFKHLTSKPAKLVPSIEENVAPVEEMLHKIPQTLKFKPEAGDVCADCKAFVKDLQAMIDSKATEEEVEDLIKQELCANIGPYKDACDGLVQQYIPQIMEVLKGLADPTQICDAMQVCKGDKFFLHKLKLQTSKIYRLASRVGSSTSCEICETAFKELKTLISEKSTQEDVENFIKKNLCAQLGSFKTECEDDVTEYGGILFELVMSELDSTEICTVLGFCAKKKSDAHVTAGVQCVMCEFVMDKLEAILSDNATEQEIIQAVEKVCSVLPSSVRKECDKFVEEYGPTIIILIKDVGSKNLCSFLGLCKQTSVDKSNVAAGTEQCELCETVLQYVDSLLKEKTSVEEIEKVLDKVCNFLPASLRTNCEDFVKQYTPILVQLIAEGADPATICKKIGLCTAGVQSPIFPVLEPVIVPQKAQLLGERECTYGPSYWCASHANAQKCKAIRHCSDHVWKNGVPRL